MLELIKALTVCQTIKELYVKQHIALLFIVWAFHVLLRFIRLGFILDYLLIRLGVYTFISYCVFVIVANLGIPFIDHFLNFPVYTPLTNCLWNYISLAFQKLTHSVKEKKTTTQIPARTPSYLQPNIQPAFTSTNDMSIHGVGSTTSSLFGSYDQVPPKYHNNFRPYDNKDIMTGRLIGSATSFGINKNTTTAPTTKIGTTYQEHSSHDLKRMLEESDRLAAEARQQTRLAPSLSFAPSIPPPRPPAKRMDKTLWQLSRTDKMEEDFREEQVALMNEHWEKVITSSMRHMYRERLTKWLSSVVFHPLASGMAILHQRIHPYTIADCPSNIMATIIHADSTTKYIRDAVHIPGYDDSVAKRQYVCDRIKDLASCDNLQSYRWTKSSPDLPGDDIILMHCFKTYMEYEMPNVVPPLIAEEGGVFLFLLVFFYITEELRDQIFHL
ncbi:uncharacterized protein BX664DRAFT_334256 [Halteromyces radiatus]|uniref:uncharacterized protein n=1 Tax=Halteromyces radiatus TaxID=101107 RepID=UPI002220F528|nr:uncharacterized protein BX664DRAFT_334256 [Halteromyces radiatus]KAI8089931.1 hypothetical protein BX664DRAFT_334256 [Halteromyces radiatus]